MAASFTPHLLGWTGLLYLAGALLLGAYFLASTLAFRLGRDTALARGVLRASLVYLPSLLLLWVLDRGLYWLLS